MNAYADVSLFPRNAKPLTSYRKYWAARFGTVPFLRDTIQRVAGEGVTLLDPAEAVARELARRLADSGSLTAQTEQGSVQFFTSGDVAQAQAVMCHLWDAPLTVQALP